MSQTYTFVYDGQKQSLNINEDQMLGIVTVAFSRGILDKLKVMDRTGKPIDVARKLNVQPKTILLSGEAASNAEDARGDPNWTEVLAKLGGRPTKRYTLLVDTGKTPYVVQFNSLDFLHGLATGCQWFNYECKGSLRALHEGNQELENDCCD